MTVLAVPTGNPLLTRPHTVSGVRRHTHDIVTIDVRPEWEPVAFEPGQFHMVYAYGVGEAAISVSSDPATPELLSHTIRAVGWVTRTLNDLQPGSTIGILGGVRGVFFANLGGFVDLTELAGAYGRDDWEVGAAFREEYEEVLALRIMSINPVGYLVAPRLIAVLLMLPCLTIFANVVGMAGGCLLATSYDLDPWGYIADSIGFLSVQDVMSGVAKSFLFAAVICIVSCHMAFRVEGGPEGVARNTMVSVVTSLVLVIVMDGLVTAFLRNFS